MLRSEALDDYILQDQNASTDQSANAAAVTGTTSAGPQLSPDLSRVCLTAPQGLEPDPGALWTQTGPGEEQRPSRTDQREEHISGICY